MKIKNLIITSLTVFFIVLALAITLIKVTDFKFDIITHHTENDGEYTFVFKGSFNNVRKLTIKKDSKNICTLPFYSDGDIFDDSYSVDWKDINFDSYDDVILLCGRDEDGDLHYTAYIYDSESGKFISKDALMDLPNLTVDNEAKCLYTSYTTKTYIEDPTPNAPDNYEERRAIAKYEYIDGEPVNTTEKAITFYSETYYYCYSVYEYSEKYGKLTYSDEKWFAPKDIDKYPLSWD